MQTIALIYGGESSEHSVSCVTAVGVISSIDKTKYEVIEIGITPKGRFVHQPVDLDWKLEDNPKVSEAAPSVIFPIGGGDFKLATGGSLGRIDLAFPVLHGPNGEDGCIQGLLQLCHIPFVGNGVLASSVAMDKDKAKAVFRDAGIRVADQLAVPRADFQANSGQFLESILEKFELPVFVKPSRSGSSVGVSLVKQEQELGAAIELALQHDQTALVEERITGREVECSVLQLPNGVLKVSLAGEILVTGRDFYDYEAKYLGGGAELKVPTTLSAAELSEMQELAKKAFLALGCTGLARTDFFLTESGFVLTEVNTMPGFTPISMYPALWKVSGVSYPELIETLIQNGLALGSQPR
jgi:D-alanine-D-alanine ligase